MKEHRSKLSDVAERGGLGRARGALLIGPGPRLGYYTHLREDILDIIYRSTDVVLLMSLDI